MRFAILLVIALVLVSGCSITGKPTLKQGSCDSLIESLPEIIAENQERAVSVARIVDGDTIELANGDTVRLIGINTPEKDFRFYAEAKTLTKELTSDGVYLSRDEVDKDQYSRLLRYVFTEDTFVNAELVRQGYAVVYEVPPNTKYASLLRCVQEDAKQNHRGIWGMQSLNNYSVSLEVNYDAPGNDLENLNGEFVKITNTGELDVWMEDWIIKDQARHTYKFGTILLKPGETLTLYTGAGSDDAIKKELYWYSEEPIWNNDGDTAFLFDSNGYVVTETSFP